MSKENGETPKNPDIIRVTNIVRDVNNGNKPLSQGEAEMRRIVENIRTSQEIFEKSEGMARKFSAGGFVDKMNG